MPVRMDIAPVRCWIDLQTVIVRDELAAVSEAEVGLILYSSDPNKHLIGRCKSTEHDILKLETLTRSLLYLL